MCQYKDISDPKDNEGVEEQSVKKKVPVQVSMPTMKTKVTLVEVVVSIARDAARSHHLLVRNVWRWV